jgi:hypothetical protein
MPYIPLYRKWRSQNFDEIVGGGDRVIRGFGTGDWEIRGLALTIA